MGQTRVTWQRLLDARSNVNTAFILAPASAGSTPWADKLPWQQLQLSDGLPPTKPDLHPIKGLQKDVMSVYNKACGPQVGFCLFSFMGPVLGDNSPPCLHVWWGIPPCVPKHIFKCLYHSCWYWGVFSTIASSAKSRYHQTSKDVSVPLVQETSFCLPRDAALQCCLLSCIRNLLNHPCISEHSDPFIHSLPRQFKCFYFTWVHYFLV